MPLLHRLIDLSTFSFRTCLQHLFREEPSFWVNIGLRIEQIEANAALHLGCVKLERQCTVLKGRLTDFLTSAYSARVQFWRPHGMLSSMTLMLSHQWHPELLSTWYLFCGKYMAFIRKTTLHDIPVTLNHVREWTLMVQWSAHWARAEGLRTQQSHHKHDNNYSEISL